MKKHDFFDKLARYAGQPEKTSRLPTRLALLLRMSRRALTSARRVLAFDRPPIVIGGCGRSGTSLMLSVLSAHPRIFAIPIETLALCPDGYRDEPDLEAPLELFKLYRLLLLYEISPTCRRWCEKTPRNVLFFGRILERFEGVRILHVVRDGRDVVTSRHPATDGGYWVSPSRWIEDVRAGRRWEDHPNVLAVRYEDLVASFEPTLRAVCEFLGEDCPEAALRWHEHATVRSSAAWSGGSVRPLHRDSVGRWRREEHSAVVAELLADKEAVALLQHYRYL